MMRNDDNLYLSDIIIIWSLLCVWKNQWKWKWKYSYRSQAWKQWQWEWGTFYPKTLTSQTPCLYLPSQWIETGSVDQWTGTCLPACALPLHTAHMLPALPVSTHTHLSHLTLPPTILSFRQYINTPKATCLLPRPLGTFSLLYSFAFHFLLWFLRFFCSLCCVSFSFRLPFTVSSLFPIFFCIHFKHFPPFFST